MVDRLQKGEYGQQSELAQIDCKFNVEIIVFENGTQQWIQKQQEPANNSTLLPSGGVVTQYSMTG